MKRIKKNYAKLVYLFIIGITLTGYGIIKMFFLPSDEVYSDRFFQYYISNGSFALIIGLGFLVGFFMNIYGGKSD